LETTLTVIMILSNSKSVRFL